MERRITTGLTLPILIDRLRILETLNRGKDLLVIGHLTSINWSLSLTLPGCGTDLIASRFRFSNRNQLVVEPHATALWY